MRVINAFLKWVAVLVVSLSAGLIAIIFLASRPDLDIFLQRLIMLAAIAFLGSLTSRILYRRLPGVFLLLLALISEILAVLAIDHFYESTYEFTFLTHDFTLQNPIVSDYSQAALMLLVSLPVIFFLRRRKKVQKVEKEQVPPEPRVPFGQRIQPVLVKLNPANWKFFKQIKRKAARPTAKSISTSQSKLVRISASSKKPAAVIKSKSKRSTGKKPAAIKPSLPRKVRQTATNDVKLVGEEDHVCPYCLEQVHKNDKRGVVICQECGTWHHKDCWDLTGSCGVAHRNEL
jgi:ribosomal protein L37AE/L43A